ncbi:MAG: hypothetical protein KIT09_02235 [Bryobacteraceae bacterium]|nr:hypothetical protein [Bryobacteraceae bacterium]
MLRLPSFPAASRSLVAAALASALLLSGCARDTLFKSNFDSTAVNQPPAAAQEVGTARVHGGPGSVIVVDPPVAPSGKWLRIGRANADTPVAGFQGVFSEFRGDGDYTFSANLFMPTGAGVATVQFEPTGQPVDTLTSFLHVDFTTDNRVRIDDDDAGKFGAFQRDQPFILQVTLNINATSPSARIVLSGATASGQKDHAIAAPFRSMARQFGAIRVWMGFPHTGAFNATNIVVTRRRD